MYVYKKCDAFRLFILTELHFCLCFILRGPFTAYYIVKTLHLHKQCLQVHKIVLIINNPLTKIKTKYYQPLSAFDAGFLYLDILSV